MNSLFIFLYGFMAAVVIIPILQGIVDVVFLGLEYIKSIISRLIATENVKIEKLRYETPCDVSSEAIGFHYYAEDEPCSECDFDE